MGALRLVAAALLLAACYAPEIQECSLRCGAGGACPVDTSCRADGFCHGPDTPLCAGNPDAALLTPDARGEDARPADADAAAADAAAPDARPAPDAGGGGCSDTIETVEGGAEEDAAFADLTFVDGGHEHLTYIDERAGVLRYVHRVVGGGWSFETVAPAAAQLKGQAVDADGGVHVAFSQSLPTPRLAYAYRPPAGGWRTETVDARAPASDAAIAVSAEGVVRIVYWFDASDLLMATRFAAGGDWLVSAIDTEGTVGEHPAIAIGPAGALHVSYRVGGTRLDLGYARMVPLIPVWDVQRPDASSDNVGAHTALAVDRQGTAHIAYADLTRETLKYATVTSNGTRRVVTADETRGAGKFNAIAVDGRGGVHIATYDSSAQDLRYVSKGSGGSSFRSRVLAGAGNVGRHASLAVDGLGVVHIAYIDEGQGDLAYAIVCP